MGKLQASGAIGHAVAVAEHAGDDGGIGITGEGAYGRDFPGDGKAGFLQRRRSGEASSFST